MRMYPILLLVVGLVLSACADPGGPSTGAPSTAGPSTGGPSTGTPVQATNARVTVTTTGLDINRDGYRVAVDGSDRGPISANGTILIRLDPGPRTIALTGLTLNCAVDGLGSRTVTVGAAEVTPIEFAVACTAWSGAAPTRPRIAFVRRPGPGPDGMLGPPEIYIANADGSEAARLTSGESPAWSPDGRRIAFNRGATIHVIDRDGSNERPLRQGGHPAWSPDGTRIVFHGTGFNRDDGILLMNADGSGLTRLLRRDFAHPGSGDWTGWPEWSPDGRRISFVLAPDYDSYDPWQIYVMNADGSDPRSLNILHSFAEVHTWSPDGSRIAMGVQEADWTIASVNSSGADFRVHYRAEPGGYAGHPDWSPDGRRLVFNRYVTTSGCEIPSCPMRIFVISTEGGPARQLIPEVERGPDYWDEQPAWSRASE